MLATVVLALLLFLFPTGSPTVTHIPPGVHAVEAGAQVKEVVDLSPQSAQAYHVVRPDGATVQYEVTVLQGEPIDVYLMPASFYEVYASGGPSEYIVGFSQQATRVLQRTFNDGTYLDTYLVVDNLDGPTGAAPTGNVTVRVALHQSDPAATQALLSDAVVGALVLTLAVVPSVVRWYIKITGVRPLPPSPPPEP